MVSGRAIADGGCTGGLARQTLSSQALVDIDAARAWTGHGLLECLAVGGTGRGGDAARGGEPR